MNIFEKIREAQKQSRLNGMIPTHILLTPEEAEEYYDYVIQECEKNAHAGVFSDFPTNRVLGMEVITDEKRILRLNSLKEKVITV